jgi:hypothetical protein
MNTIIKHCESVVQMSQSAQSQKKSSKPQNVPDDLKMQLWPTHLHRLLDWFGYIGQNFAIY